MNRIARLIVCFFIAFLPVAALSGCAAEEHQFFDKPIASVDRDSEFDQKRTGVVGQADSTWRDARKAAWGVARWTTYILICLTSVVIALIPGAFWEGAVALIAGLVLLGVANSHLKGVELLVMAMGPILCFILPGIAAVRGRAGVTRTDDFAKGAGRFVGVLGAYAALSFLHWMF